MLFALLLTFVSFVCPAFFMSFKFLNVTSCTLCFSSYAFVQGCHFLPSLRYRSRACSPAFANLPLGRIRFSWPAILVRVLTLSCVFVFVYIFLLFALPSLSGRLRLYLFGLFIYLHIYRTVPAPSIPLRPFLFCLNIKIRLFAFVFLPFCFPVCLWVASQLLRALNFIGRDRVAALLFKG